MENRAPAPVLVKAASLVLRMWRPWSRCPVQSPDSGLDPGQGCLQAARHPLPSSPGPSSAPSLSGGFPPVCHDTVTGRREPHTTLSTGSRQVNLAQGTSPRAVGDPAGLFPGSGAVPREPRAHVPSETAGAQTDDPGSSVRIPGITRCASEDGKPRPGDWSNTHGGLLKAP